METPSDQRPAAAALSYERVPTRALRAPNPRQNLVLAWLTAIVCALSAVMVHRGAATWLEAVSVAVGAVCVWLTVRESVWNFPLGLVNAATFALLFYRSGLFADASLQVVFFVLCAAGWYFWLFGGAQQTVPPITNAAPPERWLTLIGICALWLGYWFITHKLGGSAPAFDALTTALSIGAQWLLTRKRIENWYLWIVADVIYVPLYWYKGLYLTAVLYVIFLVMATMGLLHWRRLMLAQAAHQTWEEP